MKKFFKDRKLGKSFSSFGHKLNESSESESSSSSKGSSSKQKSDKTQDTLQSAVKHKGKMTSSGSSRREIGSEVLFKCPALSPDVSLTKNEWTERIQQHLAEVREIDKVLSAILAIKTLNAPAIADKCISTILVYLKNLIEFPENEKYKSIRMGNPRFTENILNVEGALDFLLAIGFEKKMVQAETEELYLTYNPVSQINLKELMESVLDINGIELQLDRDFRVLTSKEISKYDKIPMSADFFELSTIEIKNEQVQRAKEIEESKLLKTKKMRELEKPKQSAKKPLYTRIRVRLPDELTIQGTFSVNEKLKNLRNFLNEKLEIGSSFTLTSPPSRVFSETDEEKTFVELDLHPAVNLILNTSQKVSIKKVS